MRRGVLRSTFRLNTSHCCRMRQSCLNVSKNHVARMRGTATESRVSMTRYTAVHGWRVSLRRRGQMHVRNFPDRKHGGSIAALAAAKLYRDELIRRYPPLTRIEFADVLRRNNTSGVPGVSRVQYAYRLVSGAKRQAVYWEAIWPTQPGENERKRFSVSQFGDRGAFALACAARREGLRRVEGLFWKSARGAVREQGH